MRSLQAWSRKLSLQGWWTRLPLPSHCGCGFPDRVAPFLGSNMPKRLPKPTPGSAPLSPKLVGAQHSVRVVVAAVSFIQTDPPLAAGAVVLSHLLALRAPAQPFHTVRAFGHNASCSWLTYSLSLQARTCCGAWLLVPSASLLLQQQPTCWSFCVLHGTQFMQRGPTANVVSLLRAADTAALPSAC